jgi:hypothetical protein
VLQIFPFLAWLAAIASIVLLTALWSLGELGPRSLPFLIGWFLLAACCQFLVGSAVVGAAGHVLQTILAIYLILRWKLS